VAGETRGELAEAIAKVALERALKLLGRKETVFWQESPDGAVIKPDFTIGSDAKSPDILVLVNASGSPKESEKKYWRNVGEVFDTKSRLVESVSVLNVVFLSEIKPELVKLTESICDATCLVDRDPLFGPAVAEWLEAKHESAPSKRDERVELVIRAITRGEVDYDASFARAMQALAKKLSGLLFQTKATLASLWKLCRTDYLSRRGAAVRSAKTTMLRRGLARWLVFENEIRGTVLTGHLQSGRIKLRTRPTYAEPLGMLNRGIGYQSIPAADDAASDMTGTTSRDLRLGAQFFSDATKGDIGRAVAALEDALTGAPEEMRNAAAQLRKVPSLVDGWHDFVLSEWSSLTQASGCFDLLTSCAADPTMAGRVQVEATARVWLWDHAVALIRASHGRNNDFGYSSMVGIFKAGQGDRELTSLFDRVISSLSGRALKVAKRWIAETLPDSAEPGRRGFQDWLAGTKDVSPVVIAAFAFALSRELRQLRNPRSLDVAKVLDAHAYNSWNKLLTHQDFEPLPALIEAACGSKVRRLSAHSIMGELGGASVQDAGRMAAYSFDGGLIFWQSVTAAGRDHKRKEISARGRALMYSYDGRRFGTRSGARKLVLVLDGEWRDEDLTVLAESGWDEFIYPDEMELLVKSIA
jgi:hypothetical protein